MNWMSKVIPVALALSLLASTAVFADSTVVANDAKANDGLRPFFAAKMSKIDSEKMWRKGPRMMNTENCTFLTQEQKTAISKLKEELRAGNLTPDQAKEKMSELFPEGMPQRLNQGQRGSSCQLNRASTQENMPRDCNFMGRKGGFNKGQGFGAKPNILQ